MYHYLKYDKNLIKFGVLMKYLSIFTATTG